MASGGGKPGITAKITIAAVFSDAVVIQFKSPEDFAYFQGKTGDEFVAQFQPTPPVDPGSGQPE